MRRTCILLASALLVGMSSSVLALPASASVLSLSIQASPSHFPVGVAIYHVAGVSLGVNPTGPLTSRLYGANDSTCARPPIFTTVTPVSGNGNYQSAWYHTKDAGSYRWVVAYSGDAVNPATTTSCGDPRAEVVVTKRTPTLDVASSALATTGAVTATGTLDLGAGSDGPKGTISFRLYGLNNPVCAGPPVFTSIRTVHRRWAVHVGAVHPDHTRHLPVGAVLQRR